MMKKIILSLCCLMAIGNAFADSYFTIGENDTLLVYPNQMANSYLVQVKADFNGRTDEWNMTFSFPTGMQAYSISAGDDMSIPYYNHKASRSSTSPRLPSTGNTLKFRPKSGISAIGTSTAMASMTHMVR